MTDMHATVAELQQRYIDAVAAKDVAAFMAMYSPAVRVFDAWDVWQYDGAPAWRHSVEGWFGSLGDEGVRVSFDETLNVGTADSIMTSSIVTFAAVAATGEVIRAMQNRISWGVHLNDGDAVIVHEHTSAPIGFDGMKAILKK